ncbi:single-stranded-DNA-specific exonuclease RecJ [Nemorincola caseinilytica]|uniref:Single-stranded-DNA-specific exonuclease RecJ n=1 Tax=Nemorincola caseinilytica TaxID=2054315 RepID=A0ABP8NAM0_9BACT
MGTEKRWTIKPADEQVVSRLYNELQVQPAICRLLAVRGITDFESARLFFRPELSHLHDPFLMKGMKKAVDRIAEAIDWHERIMVYGDYDVDGTTAVSVVYSFLKELYKGEVSYYIPHRYREGYGISRQGIDHAHSNGYTLMITLDCGIKSTEMIDYARSLGIDVIVCDHHLPDAHLPPAYAILNPKQADCTYPYKELSGCGIGFKLISALATRFGRPMEQVYHYLDLVATSIAADIVPIDGENRILAFYGMKQINESPCQAIAVLKELGGVQRALTISDLVFVIGPRVNAAGRMDDAKKAVEFFTETDHDKIIELAAILHSDNDDRREIDKNITEEALSILNDDDTAAARHSTVLYRPHWHKGVVGIVASRLIDHYYRPTIVLTSANGKATGSARSVSGFNIYEAIHECRDLLDNYGGHFFAAGMTMPEERVNEFIDRFEATVAATITQEQRVPEIEIDAEIPLTLVKQTFYNLIRQFEPFGPFNMKPVFLTRGLYDHQGSSQLIRDAHIRIVAHQHNGPIIEGIGFGIGDRFPHVKNGPFDMLYNIEENEYNGTTRLQVKVVDIRPTPLMQ